MPSPQKFQCRHIFPDGHRCGSPTLRREPFCYYHHTTRKPKAKAAYADTHALFELPDLEDRSSIQAAITLVLQRLANGNLDPKRAGLLLYGLQIASANLPKLLPILKPVEDLVEDEVHGEIARESYIDTSMADALSDIICHRMGIKLEAVADPNPPTPTPITRRVILTGGDPAPGAAVVEGPRKVIIPSQLPKPLSRKVAPAHPSPDLTHIL